MRYPYLLLVLTAGLWCGPVSATSINATQVAAALIDPGLGQLLPGLNPVDPVDIIIDIKDKIDAQALRDSNKALTQADLIEALKQKTLQTQAAVITLLKKNGITQIRQFWLSNKIAVTVPVSLIPELEQLPAIGRLSLDAPVLEPSSGYQGSGEKSPSITPLTR